jgi:hypothetical protein
MTITPKTISIKAGIIVLFLLTLRWLMSGPSWRRPLFNIFNLGDQIVNSFHHLLKLLIDVDALVIKKLRKLVLGHTLIEGDSIPFLHPLNMVRRQQKITARYYPINQQL